MMSQQNGGRATAIQRPTTNDPDAWKTYWEAQGQLWRTEQEIDEERQKYLAERRSIKPNWEQGIYPFKDIKLTRADVEWLLATHENGRGPVDWNDESQREREGLDLRGANLRQEYLSGLPLARMSGGLAFDEWYHATEEERNIAAAQLQKARLTKAQLQGANLRGVQLQGAYLATAQLQKARLTRAQLQGANLRGVQLQGAYLWGAQLQKANLGGVQLQGAYLHMADLEDARLGGVTLSDQIYGSARLADIRWGEVNLAVIDWGHVTRLGDEEVAQQEKDSDGKIKDKQTRVNEYKEAVRANRQLAVVLRDQGLNEEADHFAYRAQLLHESVKWFVEIVLPLTLIW